ncbi:MAG: hypothetical protein NZ455_07265 [Bacteroidia bacterium]|nr:hypothetical protein [Bacteroidia bacterium]
MKKNYPCHSLDTSLKNNFIFLGVPLADARVGAFRTTLRFGTSLTLRTA